MDFKFGVLLAIVAHICVTQALPPCTCTRNYRPICASNGQTYANLCLMECSGSDLSVVREGPCEISAPENCICPYNYLPVCGTDGITYPNRCTLDCQTQRNSEVQIKHAGACSATSAPEPPCVCGRDNKPVCGSDGNTYNNACLLNCATKNNSNLSIQHPGRCADKVRVVSPDLNNRDFVRNI